MNGRVGEGYTSQQLLYALWDFLSSTQFVMTVLGLSR